MTIMNSTKNYVRMDEHGVMRVGETDISLDSVVIAFQEGQSPESIQQDYPGLSLEEVYGAITYYLANGDEVHQYLERQDKRWEEWRKRMEAVPSPVVERLRALRRETKAENR